MKKYITRDSVVLTVAALGALVTYLSNANSEPTKWGYNEWLQFVAFVVAWLSGKLATSPLPGQSVDRTTTEHVD
jgi:hypothetical protein